MNRPLAAMKTFVLFAVVLILFVDVSQQLPKLNNCAPDYVPPASVQDSCGSYTCDGDGIRGVGCSPRVCAPGTQQGYIEPDNTKVYPDCCGGPICAL